MVPLANLFVQVYVWIDDAIKAGTLAIPVRPGPRPTCSDAEVLTIALVRHLRRRHDAESAFVEEVRQEWRSYFLRLPHQSEFNRRARWLWGAFAHLRQHLAEPVDADAVQQIDTSALPSRAFR